MNKSRKFISSLGHPFTVKASTEETRQIPHDRSFDSILILGWRINSVIKIRIIIFLCKDRNNRGIEHLGLETFFVW